MDATEKWNTTLELACYAGMEGVITHGVVGMTQDLVQVLDPVLMSCVTLNAIVRDNEMGYHDVVHLLEWLHFRFPDILEERKYIQLLVELKTKVVCYQISIDPTENKRKAKTLLDKMFSRADLNPPPPPTVEECETMEQYHSYTHNHSRRGLLDLISNQQVCDSFKSSCLLNTKEYSQMHGSLVQDIQQFVKLVKKKIRTPVLFAKLMEQFSREVSASKQNHHKRHFDLKEFSIVMDRRNFPSKKLKVIVADDNEDEETQSVGSGEGMSSGGGGGEGEEEEEEEEGEGSMDRSSVRQKESPPGPSRRNLRRRLRKSNRVNKRRVPKRRVGGYMRHRKSSSQHSATPPDQSDQSNQSDQSDQSYQSNHSDQLSQFSTHSSYASQPAIVDLLSEIEQDSMPTQLAAVESIALMGAS